MMFWASVKRRETHEPTRHLAKDGISGGYRREELLEARPIEEAIAAEARVREEMNARTPLVDLRTSAKEERKHWKPSVEEDRPGMVAINPAV
jgi:hypothetical protein